jgi:hypothetical protein
MNLEETLRVLYDAGVEVVLIGGAAMGLQGSAHLTKDIDFCYQRSRPNLERLANALKRRQDPNRTLLAQEIFKLDAGVGF